MNIRRAGAVIIAIALIAGAWVIRTRVLDDDTDPAASPDTPSTVICIPELREVCIAALKGRTDLTLRFEPTDTTLTQRGTNDPPESVVWVTMQPFPAMVDRLRETTPGLAPLDQMVTRLASSPLALVIVSERAEAFETLCPEPVELRCLGDVAGNAWDESLQLTSANTIRPGFGPAESAIGQLGTTAAAVAYTPDVPLMIADAQLQRWLGELSSLSTPANLSGRTAVQTLQTRAVFDIAVGTATDLADGSETEFAVLDIENAVPVEVVAVTGGGSALPDGLRSALNVELVAAGWNATDIAIVGATISAADMLAVRALRKDQN